MIDLDAIRDYIKWRGCLTRIAEESGYPYLDLSKFVNGKTAEPRLKNIKRLTDWIDRDSEEFVRRINAVRHGSK